MIWDHDVTGSSPVIQIEERVISCVEVALLLWSDIRVWFIVSVLKTDVWKRTVGSNLTLTA